MNSCPRSLCQDLQLLILDARRNEIFWYSTVNSQANVVQTFIGNLEKGIVHWISMCILLFTIQRYIYFTWAINSSTLIIQNCVLAPIQLWMILDIRRVTERWDQRVSPGQGAPSWELASSTGTSSCELTRVHHVNSHVCIMWTHTCASCELSRVHHVNSHANTILAQF